MVLESWRVNTKSCTRFFWCCRTIGGTENDCNQFRPLTNLRKDRIMAKQNFTLARVHELLNYDKNSGIFTWKKSLRGPVKAGDQAGYKRSDGYIKIKIDGSGVWAHRLAWFYVHGSWPTNFIDHINGDPSDNRMCNIRDVAPIVNSQNERAGRRRKNGGTLIGAHWSSIWRRWKSSICTNGEVKHIGWFDTEEQAHAAYISSKRLLHEGCTI